MDKFLILIQNWADTNVVREVSYTLMCVRVCHVHVRCYLWATCTHVQLYMYTGT